MNNEQQIASIRIRQVLILLLIVSLGVFMFYQLAFMLSSFLGAITLFMILRSSMYRLVYEKKWKKWIAACVLMIGSFVVLILPFTWVGYILINKISPFFNNSALILENANKIQDYINNRFGFDILSEKNIELISSKITDIALPFIGSLANALMNIVVAYFLLWFMLYNAGKIERWLLRNLPFNYENRNLVLKEVRESVISNAVGLPIMAAIQGILAAIGFWIFGVNDFVVWGTITGICSFIPFVGTIAGWAPLALLSFANGDFNNGIGLVIWGLVVIGMSDNIVRMVLQKQIGDAHPLVTVFGVIVGLNIFGFLGLIFGPLLISLFLLLVKIYYAEYVKSQS